MVSWGENAGEGITLETPEGDKPVRYYIVTFAGTDPESGPLDQADVADVLGMPLYGLGVGLIYSLLYVSPSMMNHEFLAIHEVWHKLSPNDKARIGMISPALSLAITAITEGTLSGDQDPAGAQANDAAASTELDSLLTPEAERELADRERLDHPALNDQI